MSGSPAVVPIERAPWPDWPWYGVSDDPLPALAAWADEGRAVAVATLVSIEGSSPRPLGSEMFIADDGRCTGYVSGGCVEAAVVDVALGVIADGEPVLLDYGRGSDIVDIQLACGGRIGIFVRLLAEPRHYLRLRTEARAARRTLSVVIDLASGVARCTFDQVRDKMGLCVVRHVPPLRLVAVGSDPVALAVCAAASQAGMEVVLLRPNGPLAPPDNVSLVAYDARPLSVSLKALVLDARCALYTFTHDEDTDHAVLARGLSSEVFATGALGSRVKIPRRIDRLIADGFDRSRVGTLMLPAGLSIGARTPGQIAVAVVAQVLMEAT